MKQLVVISGKGGTGKTSLTGSLAALHSNQGIENPVIVDCDVDAPNLEILLGGEEVSRNDFFGPRLARIDQSASVDVNLLEDSCRFGAIFGRRVDPFKCVGCAACSLVAPEAVEMIERKSGEIIERTSRFGQFFFAELLPGRPGFGGVISALRMKAEEAALTGSDPLLIIDGSPGLGCRVVAGISGCDLALLITEPGKGALHDLERIWQLLRHFNIETRAVINRFDIDPGLSRESERFCRKRSIPVIGRIPFSEEFNRAVIERRTVVEGKDAKLNLCLEAIYRTLRRDLYGS